MSDRQTFSQKLVRRFLGDERGATAIEYAIIGGLLSIVIVAGATIVGTKLSKQFGYISGNLS